MSLTHEQRYLLEELREYLRRVEKMAARYRIDLDEFDMEYSESGPVYALSQKKHSTRLPDRKTIFEKAHRHELVNYYQPEAE